MFENAAQKIDLEHEDLHQKIWNDLLRAKLEDLESAQLINKDLKKEIFFSMTNTEFNLK
jgi:hypothetical protein